MYDHIKSMSKPSNRDKILQEGLKLVHERGFGGASVRDIVQAAGVPQGSFTNHFASKEAFGLEIIEIYAAGGQELVDRTLRNDGQPPLERLAAYLDATQEKFCGSGMKAGCMLGNFAAEAAETGDSIRQRVMEVFRATEESIAYCLEAAVKAGDLPEDFAVRDVAGFILSSLQGVNLLGKTIRSVEPFERFKRVLFERVLR